MILFGHEKRFDFQKRFVLGLRKVSVEVQEPDGAESCKREAGVRQTKRVLHRQVDFGREKSQYVEYRGGQTGGESFGSAQV